MKRSIGLVLALVSGIALWDSLYMNPTKNPAVVGVLVVMLGGGLFLARKPKPAP